MCADAAELRSPDRARAGTMGSVCACCAQWRLRYGSREISLRDAGRFRSRLLTVVTFVCVLAAGGAWFTQCQPAARNVPVGGAHVSGPDRPAQRLPTQQVPGAASSLVPGSPDGLLACRFHGLNQPQPVGSFAAAATFAPAPIAAALNGAKVPTAGAVYHCPADFGEVIV